MKRIGVKLTVDIFDESACTRSCSLHDMTLDQRIRESLQRQKFDFLLSAGLDQE